MEMPTLKKGSKGLVVARLQNVLSHGAPGQWKVSPGAIDEKFGPKTKKAVEAFQKWAKIPVTGVVDETTWSAGLGHLNGTLAGTVDVEHTLR